MARRPVSRTDGQAFSVPVPGRRLGGLRLRPPTIGTKSVHHPTHLGRGGDIAAQHAARNQDLANRLDALPWGKHVEDGAVDRLGRNARHQIGDLEVPGGRHLTIEGLDVLVGDVSELLPPLIGMQASVRPNGAQQWDRQAAGPDSSLQHARPGEDVGPHRDLGRLLGVDDRGLTRHGDGELAENRSHGQELQAADGGDDDSLRPADEVVVAHCPLRGVEDATRLQDDRVFAPLGISEGDPLPSTQDSPAAIGHRSSRLVGKVPQADEISQ